MAVNTLMYVGANVRAGSPLAKTIKANVSKVPGAKYFFVPDSVYGKNCLCIEFGKGRTADYQVNRLLKILPADLASRPSPQLATNCVTISIACLAVHREVEVDLKPATLKRIVGRNIRLKIMAFSMQEATAYRDHYIKGQKSDFSAKHSGK